ncbi:TPA: AraC family transcriptional regulator [Bacillus wiedmannii]|nr:AraC family transcriptional regulator [Bacillus wiedmannii]
MIMIITIDIFERKETKMNIPQRVFGFECCNEYSLKSNKKKQHEIKYGVLIIVQSGTGKLKCNNQITHLGSGSVYMVKPNGSLVMENTGEEHFLYDIYEFGCYRLREERENILLYELSFESLPSTAISYTKASKKVKIVSAELKESAKEKNAKLCTQLLRKLLFTIEEEYEARKRRSFTSSFHDVLEYINLHSHQSLTRDEVAKYFGYHPNYFSERIKKDTGWSFSDYLTHMRMDKAKLLLLDPNYTVNEVARKVGYQDGLYLSRKFKQQMGITPTQFRNGRNYKRIFTYQFTGALMATGIKPKGVFSWAANVPEYLHSDLSGTVFVQDGEDLSPELWINLKPDLIIAPTYLYQEPQLIEQMEKFAPVLMMDWDKNDRIEDVRTIARIVGREEETETWIQCYKKKAKKAKEQILSVLGKEETVGLYELRNDNRVGIWRPSARGAYNLYKMMELNVPQAIRKEVIYPNKHLTVPESRIEQYAADHMLVVVHSNEQTTRLFESEAWLNLRQQKKKVYILQLQDFWASEGVCLEKQLDIQVKKLVEQQYI